MIDLWIPSTMPAHDDWRVPPFGHLRLTACVRLPEAFRSSPRPSSPQRAKASSVCSSFLDSFFVRISCDVNRALSSTPGCVFRVFLSPPCQRSLYSHGDERIRTADPLLARQVFSQLNYAPSRARAPATSSVAVPHPRPSWAYLDLNQGPHAYQACALNQLSYRPFDYPV